MKRQGFAGHSAWWDAPRHVVVHSVFERVGARLLPTWSLAVGRALFLGAFDSDALTEVTIGSYAVGTSFASADWNVSFGLFPWESEVFLREFDGARRIVVVGAGGGRESIALARHGFEVTAFDATPRLVEACRRNVRSAAVDVSVLDALPDALPGSLTRFDAVLIGRGVYHHVPGRARRIALLAALRRHVDAGAPLVVGDFHERDVGSPSHAATHRLASVVRRARSSLPPELGDDLTVGFQHFFVRAEIESELEAAGFTSVRYATTPFGEGARLAHATARARAGN